MYLFYSFLQADNSTVNILEFNDSKMINKHMSYYEDTQRVLSIDSALKKYQENIFKKNHEEKVSFGFTKSVIWAALDLYNPNQELIEKNFKIDTGWLDRVDIYFINKGMIKRKVTLGDSLDLVDNKGSHQRIPYIKYSFEKGTTTLLMRLDSLDPVIFPTHILNFDEVKKDEKSSSYFYGFLYGAFIILLIYNLAIFISLREYTYLFYSFYLASFLLFNIAYTGHGYTYLWTENSFLNEYGLQLFMYSYILSAVMFTFEFLKLKHFMPTVYKYRHKIYIAILIPSLIIVMTQSKIVAISFALFFIMINSFYILILGYLAIKNGNNQAKYFVPAILMGAGGATVSSGITYGIFPYSTLLFHSAEIGMLLEMILLALVLSYNLKTKDQARLDAEYNAKTDYLTKLYNRRAFYSEVKPLWSMMKRNKKSVAIILIDVDFFKSINDHYGHEAGDYVLQGLADILKNNTKDGDVIARWGGEEFIIFLSDSNIDSAAKVAEKIRKSVEEAKIKVNQNTINFTISSGVADSSNKKYMIEDIINLSDKALYKAKQNGRNRVEWAL
jgi:diguanylate cyclase (GGDEF)-like protein